MDVFPGKCGSTWPGLAGPGAPSETSPTVFIPHMDLAGSQFSLCHLRPGWAERIDDPTIWQRVADLPTMRSGPIRQTTRRKLMRFIRDALRDGWIRGHLPTHAGDCERRPLLDPEAPIGFARRRHLQTGDPIVSRPRTPQTATPQSVAARSRSSSRAKPIPPMSRGGTLFMVLNFVMITSSVAISPSWKTMTCIWPSISFKASMCG